jgi:hypothetical protein
MKWFLVMTFFFLLGVAIGWHGGERSAERRMDPIVVVTAGSVGCAFDGPAIEGHLAVVSTTRAGFCQDAGQVPLHGQVLGVITGNLLGGVAPIKIFGDPMSVTHSDDTSKPEIVEDGTKMPCLDSRGRIHTNHERQFFWNDEAKTLPKCKQ